MSTMNDTATRLKMLKDMKDELKEKEKQLSADIDAAEKELSDIMIDEGNDSFELNGFKFSLNVKDYYSLLAENREQFIDVMANYGWERESIVTETIPNPKLQTIVKSVIEESDDPDEIPEDLKDIVSSYTKQSISIRKSARK